MNAILTRDSTVAWCEVKGAVCMLPSIIVVSSSPEADMSSLQRPRVS